MAGNHIVCVHSTHEGQLVHALQFLKEGLDNNETCILITNYRTKEGIENIMRNVWGTTYVEGFKANGNCMIFSTQDWYFRDQPLRISKKEVINSWQDLSRKAIENGKNGLRAFGDTSLFFKYGLGEDLVSYESELDRIPDFPLNAICAYLHSDISSLSPESSKLLYKHHRHVYFIPQ